MAQKFLTNVELEAGLVDGSNSTGTSGYLLSSTGTATSWVDPAAVSVGESEQVHIACKNTSGVAISKGDPVYITGTVGTSFRIEIAKADASDSAKMPAVGLAETDLGLNAEGFVIVSGVLKNLTTDPLSTSDGTPSSNDTVYVKAGGGLTRTKPTGSGNLIQNVGKVGRISSANAGSLAVSTIMRTNDVPNLTTGKIWVGSSTYTTESTVIHLDETNGRMGIGTASPNDLLEIKSTTIPGIRLNSTDTTFPTFGSIKAYNNTTYRGELSWANNPVQAGAKITYIGFPSGSQTTGTFEVGADFVDTSINNGSMVTRLTTTGLGIGTTSPAQRLHVDGNIRVGDSADTVFSNRFYALSNAHVYLLANSGYDLKFYAGGTEKMVVSSAGNVGIGTTSPNQRLTIKGTDQYVATEQTNYVWGGTNTIGVRMGTDTTAGVLDFRRWTGSGTLHGNALITQVLSDGGWGLDFRVDNKSTNTSATTSRMFISTSGEVGIGTTSPAYKLEVDGTFSSNAIWTTASSLTEWGSGTTAYGTLTWDTGYAKIFANSGNQLQFAAGGASTDMTIDTSGNVGIGTTNPVDKLDVRGTARITSPQANDWIVLAQNSATGAPSGFWDSNGNVHLYLRDSSSNTNVLIRPDSTSYFNGGNVGIGTTTPNQKLEVAGSTRITGSGLDVGYGNNGTNYIQIGNGRTTSGSAYIDLVGDTTYTDNGLRIIRNGSGANASSELIHRGTGIFNFNATQAGSITFRTSNIERVRINSSGDVGIGTTSPAEKLHIKSTASSSSSMLYLENAAWAVNMTTGIAFKNGANYAGPTAKIYTIMNGAGNQGGEIRFATLDYSATNPNPNTTLIDRMTIDDIGNVGVGTTSSTPIGTNITTLDVQGSSGGGFRFGRTDGIEGGLWTISSGTTLGSISSIPLYFRTGNQDRATILANGNFGIGTTNPGEKLEVNGTIKATAATDAYKGYIKNTITCTPLMKSANTSYNYIPYNTTIFNSTPDYFNRMVTPYGGRVKKIILRHISGTTPTATGMKFKKEVNGTVSTTEYTATVTGGASTSFTAIYNFANSDFTFSEGDSIGILAQTSGGTGNIGGASAQIIVEYNIT